MIYLEDVSRVYRMGYREVNALSHISLTIRAGEFVAVMGTSSSGKSTLLNIIGCLHKPTSGRYIFEDTDVMTMDDTSLAGIRNRRIGFVFQSFHLLPRLTALKNVELPLIYRGYNKVKRLELAEAVLESVGLKERLYHRPAELSGGEQQRVAIARALVNNPSLLLADEPTGNLDSASGEGIMQIFANLNKKGITIILVTHDEEKARYAHRIIGLKDGRCLM